MPLPPTPDTNQPQPKAIAGRKTKPEVPYPPLPGAGVIDMTSTVEKRIRCSKWARSAATFARSSSKSRGEFRRPTSKGETISALTSRSVASGNYANTENPRWRCRTLIGRLDGICYSAQVVQPRKRKIQLCCNDLSGTVVTRWRAP
jgi:hypothetical protein